MIYFISECFNWVHECYDIVEWNTVTFQNGTLGHSIMKLSIPISLDAMFKLLLEISLKHKCTADKKYSILYLGSFFFVLWWNDCCVKSIIRAAETQSTEGHYIHPSLIEAGCVYGWERACVCFCECRCHVICFSQQLPAYLISNAWECQ